MGCVDNSHCWDAPKLLTTLEERTLALTRASPSPSKISSLHLQVTILVVWGLLAGERSVLYFYTVDYAAPLTVCDSDPAGTEGTVCVVHVQRHVDHAECIENGGRVFT